MAVKCVPCMSERVKKAISEALEDDFINELLEKIDDCPDEVDIEVCGKKKRPRSAYQQFASTCMSGPKAKSLKECAAEWQILKKNRKN
jgi:hypothetical protein